MAGSDSLRNVWRGWKKASARDGPGLFLKRSSSKSRRSPVSCLRVASNPRRAGVSPRSLHKRVDPAWSLPLVTARYGAGLTRMPSGPGNTVAGFFHATRVFGQGGRILDLYHRIWQGQPLIPDEFVLSADERPAFRRGHVATDTSVSIGLSVRVDHDIDVWGPGLIWRPGMSTEPSCLVDASPRPGWLPLEGLSTKS